ncbi:MAG: hypothetical protein ACFE9L_14085 [Candidatus Hodarchaeota archaeon]
MAEDSIRYPDANDAWRMDGGNYWTEGENAGYNRGMNGGSYQVVMCVTQDHPEIRSLHFTVDHGTTVNITSTDFTPEFIGYWSAKIKRQLDMQLTYLIIAIAVAIVISALTAGITALVVSGVAALAGVGTFVGWGVFVVMGKTALATTTVVGGILVMSQVLGLFNPELVTIGTNIVLCASDIIAGGLIHFFVELVD